MTVETESSSRTFSGNDLTTVFATGFQFLNNSHLSVTLIDSGGVETVLTENTHYTLTGAGDDEGGDVTMLTAPATGESLYLERNTPILQTVDLRPNGPYLPDTIEEMFDYRCLVEQELRRDLDLALAASPAVIDAGSIVFVDKTFLSNANAVEAGFPLSVTVTGGSTATGCWAVRLRNLDDAAEVFDEPPAVQWAPGAGATITLNFVAGLKPGTNYTLRLAVVIP